MAHSESGLTTGVCSVSFRALAPDDVIELAAAAGLDGIEWGADLHVPVGDLLVAASVGTATRAAGLRVLSYGSYWRADDDTFPIVLATAAALGAPRIRVWAGPFGSTESTDEHRDAVADRLRAAAALAATVGIELGLEFHGGTLTDTAASTVRLLRSVDHPAVRSYWQPPIGLADDDALTGLDEVLDSVSTVHVFAWWPRSERLPLTARADLWSAVVARLRASGRPHDLLLEFVPDDDPALLTREAATLRDLVATDERNPG